MRAVIFVLPVTESLQRYFPDEVLRYVMQFVERLEIRPLVIINITDSEKGSTHT